MLRFRFLFVGVALFGLAACSHDTTVAGAQRSPGPSIVPIAPVLDAGSPTPANPFALYVTAADGVLIANPDITPGHATPDLTVATVCSAGFGVDVRHADYGTRSDIFANYGIPWSEHKQYQVDYLIPLSLGGDDSKDNLWPMPLSGPASPAMKAALTDRLHTLVCTGKLSLATAQKEVASNWWATYLQAGQPTPIPQQAPRATCAPVDAKAETAAGKPLLCEATKNGKPRWMVASSPSPSGSPRPTAYGAPKPTASASGSVSPKPSGSHTARPSPSKS
jgi:hypothetical protein